VVKAPTFSHIKVFTTSQPDYTTWSLFSLHVELAPPLLLQITQRSFRYASPYLWNHSVNLILFTVLLVHLILYISRSPHHSTCLRSHYVSLPYIVYSRQTESICSVPHSGVFRMCERGGGDGAQGQSPVRRSGVYFRSWRLFLNKCVNLVFWENKISKTVTSVIKKLGSAQRGWHHTMAPWICRWFHESFPP